MSEKDLLTPSTQAAPSLVSTGSVESVPSVEPPVDFVLSAGRVVNAARSLINDQHLRLRQRHGFASNALNEVYEAIAAFDYAQPRSNPDKHQPITQFNEVAARSYGWTISYGGELNGLIAGDMGYEGTGISLHTLLETALEVEADMPRGYNKVTEALGQLVAACREVLPAPPQSVRDRSREAGKTQSGLIEDESPSDAQNHKPQIKGDRE